MDFSYGELIFYSHASRAPRLRTTLEDSRFSICAHCKSRFHLKNLKHRTKLFYENFQMDLNIRTRPTATGTRIGEASDPTALALT